MTDASTGRVASHWGLGVKAVLTVVVAVPRRAWQAVASLAEELSDAGHGPRRWRERSDVPNPYAGMGPIPPDDGPLGIDE